MTNCNSACCIASFSSAWWIWKLLSAHAQGDTNKLLGQFAALLIFVSLVLSLAALDVRRRATPPRLEAAAVHSGVGAFSDRDHDAGGRPVRGAELGLHVSRTAATCWCSRPCRSVRAHCFWRKIAAVGDGARFDGGSATRRRGAGVAACILQARNRADASRAHVRPRHAADPSGRVETRDGPRFEPGVDQRRDSSISGHYHWRRHAWREEHRRIRSRETGFDLRDRVHQQNVHRSAAGADDGRWARTAG